MTAVLQRPHDTLQQAGRQKDANWCRSARSPSSKEVSQVRPFPTSTASCSAPCPGSRPHAPGPRGGRQKGQEECHLVKLISSDLHITKRMKDKPEGPGDTEQ